MSLPPSFALAQQSRPKLIDITGGETRTVEVAADPARVLRETMDALGRARFTFDSDRAMAEEMMNEFEWIIKMASEQALATVGAKSRFFSMSVDPKVLRSKKPRNDSSDGSARADQHPAEEAPCSHADEVISGPRRPHVQV